jgi:regulator of protease activity HflC (stomatin/prohibitin superfamily)
MFGIESLLGAITLMVSGYLIGSVRIVEEGDEALVQRLGQYQRTLKPGLNFVVPLFDTVLVETMREQLLDIQPQKAVTKDTVPIEIDAIIYWQIMDLYSAYYKVEDLEEALKNLVLSTLRSEVGQLTLEEAISSTDRINRELKDRLREETNYWGVEVIRVEVQDIILSQTMRDSLEKQRAAKAEGQATLERTGATVKSIQQISQALEAAHNPQAVLQYLIAKDYVSANMELSKSENSKILFMNPASLNHEISELISHDTGHGGSHGNGAA